MELSEAIKIIIDYFEELGFLLDYEVEDDDGRWTLLFAPNDEGIIELAKNITATKSNNDGPN